MRHANQPAQGRCFKHTFKSSECTNGLPPRGAHCVVSLKEMAQCGQEEDFKAVGPRDRANGKVMVRWWNAEPCGNARVVVDYYCPEEV